jgi:hypothetical protein
MSHARPNRLRRFVAIGGLVALIVWYYFAQVDEREGPFVGVTGLLITAGVIALLIHVIRTNIRSRELSPTMVVLVGICFAPAIVTTACAALRAF